MSSTSTMMAAPVLARSGRFTASVSMLAMFVMALVVSQASNPELVSGWPFVSTWPRASPARSSSLAASRGGLFSSLVAASPASSCDW